MNGRENQSFGLNGTSFVDRIGVWLSQNAIRKLLPRSDRLDVIEFGCGYHAVQLVAIMDRLKHGIGVDFKISPDLKAYPNLEFHECAIEEVFSKLSPQTFDLVLLISVLEHLNEPLDALKVAFSILKPGGILLVNVPTWWGKMFLEFSAFHLGLSPKVEIDDHKMYYSKRDLWPLLIRAGFAPSLVKLKYHKLGLNLFACVKRQ